jgi:hypothetical protein
VQRARQRTHYSDPEGNLLIIPTLAQSLPRPSLAPAAAEWTSRCWRATALMPSLLACEVLRKAPSGTQRWSQSGVRIPVWARRGSRWPAGQQPMACHCGGNRRQPAVARPNGRLLHGRREAPEHELRACASFLAIR